MQALAEARLGYVALLCNTGHISKVINNDDEKEILSFICINKCWIIL